MKLSNKFTLVRVIFAPIFFLLYYVPIWTGNFTFSSLLIALPCLIFAEFTDYLDGHYARKNNEVSDFGKLFDPFADVILHLTTFVCFMKSANPEISYLPVVILLLIMLREFSQNFLRMVDAKKGVAIAARKGGKFKTVMYVVSEFYALFLEILVRTENIPACWQILKTISLVLFIVRIVCSYVSFIDYLVHFGSTLKGE